MSMVRSHRLLILRDMKILYLKFKLSNQKTLFVPRDNVIFRGVACPVPGFLTEGVIEFITL